MYTLPVSTLHNTTSHFPRRPSFNLEFAQPKFIRSTVDGIPASSLKRQIMQPRSADSDPLGKFPTKYLRQPEFYDDDGDDGDDDDDDDDQDTAQIESSKDNKLSVVDADAPKKKKGRKLKYPELSPQERKELRSRQNREAMRKSRIQEKQRWEDTKHQLDYFRERLQQISEQKEILAQYIVDKDLLSAEQVQAKWPSEVQARGQLPVLQPQTQLQSFQMEEGEIKENEIKKSSSLQTQEKRSSIWDIVDSDEAGI